MRLGLGNLKMINWNVINLLIIFIVWLLIQVNTCISKTFKYLIFFYFFIFLKHDFPSSKIDSPPQRFGRVKSESQVFQPSFTNKFYRDLKVLFRIPLKHAELAYVSQILAGQLGNWAWSIISLPHHHPNLIITNYTLWTDQIHSSPT